MSKHLSLAVVAHCAVLLVASPALASFHFMKVEEVIGGVDGDTTQQAVQLRLRAGGQNQLGNNSTRLIVRDAAGANPITLLVFPDNPPVGSLGARVLVVSPAFASAHPNIPADYQMTSLIPSSYLAAGRLTFENGGGLVVWSLAWGGAGYTGSNAGSTDNDADGNYGPPFASALPSSNNRALLFSTADPSGSAQGTSNSVNYALTTGPATFTNNGGGSGTLPLDSNLAVTVTDGQTTAFAGTPVTYTITASNGGPDAVVGATVTDSFPAALTGVTWTCAASGGSSCGAASGSGNIGQTVNLVSGGNATYTATGTLSPSATGTLVNTATISAPAGVVDPILANNSATDTDTIVPPPDLAITKTDGLASVVPSQAVTYTIVASNVGTVAVTGATVTDTVPASLLGASWTCVGSGGGTCTAGPVLGNINDTVNLPLGASVTFTLSGTVSPTPTSLSNTATVAPPAGIPDSNTLNNAATDTDALVCPGETVVVADGRLTNDVIAPSTTRTFAAQLRIGDSYSVEFKSLVDAGTPPGTVTIFAGEDGCGATSSLVPTDTTGIDPGNATTSRRLSFTAAGTQPLFRITLTSASGPAIPYSFSVSDTTLFSPAWSTNGSFDTFYSFQNTTAADLSGKLTLSDTSGVVLSTFNLSIPAGQTVGTNTSTLAVTRSRSGTARFTHNGPPGAVLAEAAIANFTITPAYVQPVKFQSVREAR